MLRISALTKAVWLVRAESRLSRTLVGERWGEEARGQATLHTWGGGNVWLGLSSGYGSACVEVFRCSWFGNIMS